MPPKSTRRQFLKRLVGSGLAISGLPTLTSCLRSEQPTKTTTTKSRVVIVQHTGVFDENYQIRTQILQNMVDTAIQSLTGSPSSADAWKKLFQPTDVVGLKLNCLYNPLTIHPQVAFAIVNGLLSVGIPQNNIILWDRTDEDLIKRGYKINKTSQGVRCHGTQSYDKMVDLGSTKTRLSTILTQEITALINVCILKDHDLTGVTLSLKNHLGSVNNAGDFHPNNADPYLAGLNAHPAIKDKTRLIVCDALIAQYDGGPGHNPSCQWRFNGIMMSRDTVALDYQGLTIIQEKRAAMGLPTLKQVGRPPKHITTAANYKLGTNDPEKIELKNIKLG